MKNPFSGRRDIRVNGYLIDMGRPDLILALIAVILVASLLFIGTARASARHEALAMPAE